jgi:hypothetical protein
MSLSATEPLHFNVDVLDKIYQFPLPLLLTKNPVEERIKDDSHPSPNLSPKLNVYL